MRHLLGISLAVAVFVHGVIITAAQNQTLKFEVASIKVNGTGARGSFSGCYKPGSTTVSKGRCLFQNVTARTLIAYAFGFGQVGMSDKWFSRTTSPLHFSDNAVFRTSASNNGFRRRRGLLDLFNFKRKQSRFQPPG